MTANKAKKVFVSGKFAVIHSGHIRLFMFAKTIGINLIVALDTEGLDSAEIEWRTSFLKNQEFVDEVVLFNADIEKIILQIKPDIIIKGSEFSSRINIESEIVSTYGGELIFSSGSTFFSEKDFTYKIKKFSDKRGYFSEFLKSADFGQVSFFSILPRQVRGNHYHNTKTEKFVVITGKVRFNFINIINKKRFSILALENTNLVVNTIPGWAHNLENIGNKVAKVLVWSNEILNKKKPDTFFYKV